MNFTRSKYQNYSVIVLFLNITVNSAVFASKNSTADSSKIFSALSVYGFYQTGWVLPTNSFVRGVNQFNEPIDDYEAYSLQLAYQTSGKKYWEQDYKYPMYGAGVYLARFKHTTQLGKPIAVYGFFNAPFFKGEKLALNYELGLGFTFNWKSFNVTSNKYNVAIGAQESVYIDADLKLEYFLTPHLTLAFGPSFNHFSNGALKKPNKGINTFAPKFSLGYNFNVQRPSPTDQAIPPPENKSELLISTYIGWKNVLDDKSGVDSTLGFKGVYYSVYGISTTIQRRVSYKSKLGIGLTLGYLGSANSNITVVNGKLVDNEATFAEGFECSIYPSYELVINKLSLQIQPGFYIYRKHYANRTPFTYQRIGIKYYLFRDLFLGLNLRAYNFYVSDYLEWTIGYRFGKI